MLKLCKNTAWNTLLYLLIGASSPCYAGDLQDHSRILQSAREHLERAVESAHGRPGEIEMGRLDQRLSLAACGQPLESFLPPGGKTLGNTTVGTRCPGAGGWSVYISARVRLYGKVLVLQSPMARGDYLSKDKVQLVERDLATLQRGYYEDATTLLGQICKRHIPANTVLTPGMLVAPDLVKRGEQVTLIAGKGSFSVRGRGQAMANGSVGELVRIKAENSNRIVQGRVISAGVVKVTL